MPDDREVELAWCAGFFDGEGHVSYHRSYPNILTGTVTAQLYANVPQCSDNVEVLHEFQRITGLGKLKGPYKTKRRDKHYLWFGVKEVESLFLILKPYLKSAKTGDFTRALMGYMTHDHTASPDDYARLRAKNEKKGKRNG